MKKVIDLRVQSAPKICLMSLFIWAGLAYSFVLTGPRSETPKKFLDFSAGVRDVSLRQCVKTGSVAPPPSSLEGSMGFFSPKWYGSSVKSDQSLTAHTHWKNDRRRFVSVIPNCFTFPHFERIQKRLIKHRIFIFFLCFYPINHHRS
jgi:hypothetical protein